MTASPAKLCDSVRESLRDVMTREAPPSEPEAYTVFCLHEVDCAGDADRLAGRPAARSGRTVDRIRERHAQRHRRSTRCFAFERTYTNTDLVVIDWDAALVVDLDGYVDDVLYVLELANLQLEEYKVMDQRLDRYLDRAYDDLKRRRFGLFGTYSATLSKLRLFASTSPN